jgi:hypothetical protein
MRARLDSISITALAGLSAAWLLLGCDGGTSPPASAASMGAGDVAAAIDGGTTTSATDAGAAPARPLLCAPSPAQTTACAGLAPGAACTLTDLETNGNADADGDFSIAGTCRATVGGTSLACAPVPPQPPTERTQPCAGKSAGDDCTVERPAGGSIVGVCFGARGSGTLVCGRVRAPPQPLVDACSGKSAGAACDLGTATGGGAITGACGNGPTGKGPLACAWVRDPSARAAAACTGLPVGTACALGGGRLSFGGTCTAPASGGAPLCLVACRVRSFPMAPIPLPSGPSRHPTEPVPPYVPGTTGD